jgi:mannose-6-phosphate isomerase-like protein (cupin superfamily)
MPRTVTVCSVADMAYHFGSHGRTADLQAKGFPVISGEPNVRMEFTWLVVPVGYSTPRHHHCFDQIRYVMKGEFGVGKGFEIDEGQVAYFPEGVNYGPQNQSQDCVALILQFPGPSGIEYLTHKQLHDAQAQLEAAGGKFENGIYTRVTADGRKVNMDSHKACWEHVTGRTLTFPKGRHRQPIVMLPENYGWVPDRTLAGVEHKHLGTFGEMRTGMSFVRLAPGAKLPAGHQEDAEIRYLIDGAVTYGGTRWQGGMSDSEGTYFYIPNGCAVNETVAEKGATFFVISLPMMAEMEAKHRRGALAGAA